MRISDWSSDVCSSDLPGAGFSGRPDKLAMLPRRCARLAGDAGAALGAAATRRAARRNLPARGRALYGLLSLRGMERFPDGALWSELADRNALDEEDRKSTRLNSSH